MFSIRMYNRLAMIAGSSNSLPLTGCGQTSELENGKDLNSKEEE